MTLNRWESKGKKTSKASGKPNGRKKPRVIIKKSNPTNHTVRIGVVHAHNFQAAGVIKQGRKLQQRLRA